MRNVSGLVLAVILGSASVQGQTAGKQKATAVRPMAAKLSLASVRIREGAPAVGAVLEVRNTTRRPWKVSRKARFTGAMVSLKENPTPEPPEAGFPVQKSDGVLRIRVRYLIPTGFSMPASDEPWPIREPLQTVAPGELAQIKFQIQTFFLTEGPLRVQVQIVDGAKVVTETLPVRMDVFRLTPQSAPPEPEQIAALFGFPVGVTLHAEPVSGMSAYREGNLLWGVVYENKEETPYSIRINAFEKGTLLNAQKKRELMRMIGRGQKSSGFLIDRKNPFFTFKTQDNRIGYNYAVAGMDGYGELTLVSGPDGKTDLMILVDFDADVSGRLKTPAPSIRKARAVLEELEKRLK